MLATKLIYLIVCLIVYASTIASSAPTKEFVAEDIYVPFIVDFGGQMCSTMSLPGVVGNSACASYCMQRGYVGGRCELKKCMCNRMSFDYEEIFEEQDETLY